MSGDYILITGASSGIGQEIAIQLSAEYKLILCGLESETLISTRERCTNKSVHIIWEYNLSEIAGIRPSFENILKKNNIHVGGFIHCAGMMVVTRMKIVNYQQALQIFNVNYFSAVEIISLLLKKNLNQGCLKNILFISSILSKYGANGYNLYSSTKAALDGLMKSLSLELAPEIRVNSILPGGVKTPMSSSAFEDPEILAKYNHDYPLGIGKTSDIANLAAFLLSDKSRWITGQQIIIDGGRTANMSQK